MRVQEAKDFLVQQTAQQAALENVPLSDLEKRMMYFTESGECPEDPIELNDAFEAEYETSHYEARILKLMSHAYSRLKKENAEEACKWDESVTLLAKGDHYLSVLVGSAHASGHRSLGLPTLLGTALFGLIWLGLWVGLPALFARYGFHWRGQQPPVGSERVPVWAQRSILALMISAYAYWGLLPMLSKKPRPSFLSFLTKFFAKHRKNSAS
jgi:hypothetical protein